MLPNERTETFYVEMPEREINLLETIIGGYDGVAHVRRDWVIHDGARYVKLLVPQGLREEVLGILESARAHLEIGRIREDLT